MTTKCSKMYRKMPFESLCEMIRPGDRIFISSGPATPLKTICLIMDSNHSNLFDLEIIQLVLPETPFFQTNGHSGKCRWKTFNVGEAVAHGIQKDNVDFIPSNFAEIPYLFHSNALDVKVAIIQTSPPDSKGFLNLGVVSDIADLVIKHAPITIAEINPNVPVTHGATSVHIDQFDGYIESDAPLLVRNAIAVDDITDRIGQSSQIEK